MADYTPPELGEVESYIQSKGLDYKKVNGGKEIATACPFNGCDDDHRNNEEYHFNINTETGQYHCFKCNEKGNLITLKKHFGDLQKKSTTQSVRNKNRMPTTMSKVAEVCHNNLPSEYRKYFQDRGITDENIDKYKLGYGEFDGKKWLTIPIFEDEKNGIIKLRKLPDDTNANTPKYKAKAYGNIGSTVYGGKELLKSHSDSVLICGGELDRIIAEQMDFGMPVITSTAGEGTFKEEWIKSYLSDRRTIYICLDNDEIGKRDAASLAEKISNLLPDVSVMSIPIPEELGDKADITDANMNSYTAKDLLEKASHVAGAIPIDTSLFKEITIVDLQKILGLTIKHEDINKVVVFLTMLSAYTEDDQLNLFLGGQASSGKTYLAKEVVRFFPKVDVKQLHGVTPKALFYDESTAVDDKTRIVDLERKILVFLDQPNQQVLENLRPLLSHDGKELESLLTNRKSGTNIAEKVFLRGYPAVVFCSANMRMDEQESTRSLLISPETTAEKILDAIDFTDKRNSDKGYFDDITKNDPDSKLLKDRIIYIKNLHIVDIIIPAEYKVAERFKKSAGAPQPKHTRHIAHIHSLIKAFALLNAMFREKRGRGIIVANQSDVDAAFQIWDAISASQLAGVAPNILEFYNDVVVPAYNKANDGRTPKKGITYTEIEEYYYELHGVMPNHNFIRSQCIPTLLVANFIRKDKDPDNGRQQLVTPLVLPNPANTSLQAGPNNDPGGISFDPQDLSEEERSYVEQADYYDDDELDYSDTDYYDEDDLYSTTRGGNM